MVPVNAPVGKQNLTYALGQVVQLLRWKKAVVRLGPQKRHPPVGRVVLHPGVRLA